MLHAPAVSIVLPVWNAATTLTETLDSIAAQTFREYELIIVDDGSTDDSPALIAARAAADPRIRPIRIDHGGVVTAMNTGIEAARAPLIARMDADDRMHPERIARQLAFMANHADTDLLGSRVHLFPEEHVRGGFLEYIRWQNACVTADDIADERYVELPIANPSILFRRNLIERFGPFRDGDFPEDYEFQLRLLAGGATLVKLPEVLLDWRESPERLTRTDERYGRDAFDRLRATHLAHDPRLQRQRPLVIWGAGRRTRQRVRHLLQHGFRVSAWVDVDPNKIGRTIDGAPVVELSWLDRSPQPFVLIYVTNHGARALIADSLATLGYRRGDDYLNVG